MKVETINISFAFVCYVAQIKCWVFSLISSSSFPFLIVLVLLYWFIYMCVCIAFRCLFDLSSSSSLSVITHCSCRIVPVESTLSKFPLWHGIKL